MGEDLRKYTPRISTILRETDPRKMEEAHRRALEDPALREAVDELQSGIQGHLTPIVPLPAVTAADEEPVTKPATPRPATKQGGRSVRKRALVTLAAVASVLVPTALGIALASRHAAKTMPGATSTASAAPPLLPPATSPPESATSAAPALPSSAAPAPIQSAAAEAQSRPKPHGALDHPPPGPPTRSAIPSKSASPAPRPPSKPQAID